MSSTIETETENSASSVMDIKEDVTFKVRFDGVVTTTSVVVTAGLVTPAVSVVSTGPFVVGSVVTLTPAVVVALLTFRVA